KAKDKDVVQKRLANLKKRVEEQKKEQEKLAKEEEEKRKKEEEERAKRDAAQGGNGNGGTGPTGPKQPDKPPTPLLPWILIGGGAAVFVTGGVFGILTLGARSEAKDGCTDTAAGHI